jgi:hypothetical protein
MPGRPSNGVRSGTREVAAADGSRHIIRWPAKSAPTAVGGNDALNPPRPKKVPVRVTRARGPFVFALASVGVCAAGLTLNIGEWQVWMGVALLLVTVIAFQSIPAAIAILIAISPYNSAIRWVAGDSSLVRGLRDLMSYIIFAVFFLRYSGKGQTKKHSWVVLYFVGWCVLVQLINSSSILIGVLGLRQLVQFFLLFPVIVAVLGGSGGSGAEDLLEVIVLTAGALSVVQFVQHFGYIQLPLPESEQILRRLGDIDVPRMIPIWDVSPSGLAIYMVSAGMIVIARFMETGRAPLLWWPCLAGALSCAGLSLSHSGVLAMLAGLGVIALCGKRKALGAVVVGVALLAFLPILFGKSSFTDETTTEYSTTFTKLWADSLHTALAHPIFGTGAAPAGYLAELVKGEAQSIGDGGWPLFACQVGIPAAAVMLVWALSILFNAAQELRVGTTSPASTPRWVPLAALAAASVYFVNAHGVPWYRVGADVNFIVLVGILAALARPAAGSVRSLVGKLRRPARKTGAGVSAAPAGARTAPVAGK